ncbi:MAG: Holliday junction branch migration protein RuvA [Gammaproteobacteria bacterium]
MIFTLRGKLITKNGLLIIIDVAGIGYGVWVSMNSLLSLPEIGYEVLLHTHQIIREDLHILYGFLQEKEKFLFCELIKISGLGGKLALAILSHLTVKQFIEVVMLKDLSKLTNIPGVGKKIAERLMIEMQNNFQHKKFKELFNIDNFNNTVTPNSNNQPIINYNVINDVQEALISLGYKAKDAINTIKSIIDANNKDKFLDLDLNNKNKITEELLKKALKKLSPTYSH